jgi:hypothetical protein
MAEIVNLRVVRKRARRRQAEQAAAVNRLAHGIAKDERLADEARRDKAARDLEGHRRDEGDR